MEMRFRAIPIRERRPEVGKYVTTIDTEGQHVVYRMNDDNTWSMRDMTPEGFNNNLPMIYWLEEEKFIFGRENDLQK